MLLTPREGHPLKEGLRPHSPERAILLSAMPREGHPLKEGLRHIIFF